MREISTTVTVGHGSEKHNHDLDYRHTLSHVHNRENGVIELLPYTPYKDQINLLARPYILAYNQRQQERYAAAWDRYTSGQIKTKPRKANFKPMSLDYYTDHLNDTYHNRKTGQDKVQPMWRSLIIGLGDKADRAEGRITEEEAVKIMIDVVDQFRKDFPYFHLLGATIHLDEEGFYHCHLDYKPFYEHDIGQGLGIGIGQDSALAAMGFKPEQSIINGRDKAPLLFNAFRNQIYRRVESAMADHRIRLQYGVSAAKEPGKDSSRNQSLEIWQATQDTARDLQHQKNIALDVISQDEVSPEGFKKALEAVKNIETTLQQVEASPLTISRKDYKVSFTLFDQLRSMIHSLKETMMHLFHQLDVHEDLIDYYEAREEKAEQSIKELEKAKAQLAAYRKEQAKQQLDHTISSANRGKTTVELFLELVFSYLKDKPDAHEDLVQYHVKKDTFGPMDWEIQKMLDEICGTDYAKQDKARYFGWDYKPKTKDDEIEYDWRASP